jgi:hypothetical protein
MRLRVRTDRGWRIVIPLGFGLLLGLILYDAFDTGIVVALIPPIVMGVVTSRNLLVALRRRPKGLQVDASEEAVRRGEEVEALVTMSSVRGLEKVEVGLVCTETYDWEDISTDSEGSSASTRHTSDATAYEAWVPVESALGSQSVRVTIPPDSPFSHHGECLSFKWELMLRGRRRHRLDALAGREIIVRP